MTSPISGTGRILLVEDEVMLCRLEQEMLESLGYEVSAFSGSLEALRAFRENPQAYDVVLTDSHLPVMNGCELARELLELRADISIVLCTGYSPESVEKTMNMIGVRTCLAKPYGLHQLGQTLHDVFGEMKIQHTTLS